MNPKDDKKYWLNEFGNRYWLKKDNATLFANRPYHWVDLVSFIDESELHYDGSPKRKHVGSMTFSEFITQKDDWIIIDKQYERKQKLLKIKKLKNEK